MLIASVSNPLLYYLCPNIINYVRTKCQDKKNVRLLGRKVIEDGISAPKKRSVMVKTVEK